LDNFGRINIVVNNAGSVETGNIAEATGHLGEAPWDCVFAVNLRSAFVTMKVSIAAMIAGVRYCRLPRLQKAASNQLTR
jgi:NAD(P)-dependent dehydrogenase (short-subunit alcohol dehydrogenase family)